MTLRPACVWFADVSALFGRETYKRFHACVPQFRREEADRFFRAEDRARCVGAFYLLMRLFGAFGIDADGLKFAKEGSGRPFAVNSDLKFSISHSGSIVAAAVSARGVGVDVQSTAGDDHEKLPRYVFSDGEFGRFSAIDDKNAFFWYTWTAKESVLKYLGFGLSVSMRRIDLKGGDEICLDGENLGLSVRPFGVPEGYRACVCVPFGTGTQVRDMTRLFAEDGADEQGI